MPDALRKECIVLKMDPEVVNWLQFEKEGESTTYDHPNKTHLCAVQPCVLIPPFSREYEISETQLLVVRTIFMKLFYNTAKEEKEVAELKRLKLMEDRNVSQLKEQLAIAHVTIESLKEMNGDLRDTNRDLAAEKRAAAKALKAAEKSVNQLQSQINDLKVQLEVAKRTDQDVTPARDSKRARTDADNNREKVVKLKMLLHERNREIATLKAKVQNYEDDQLVNQ